MHMPRNSISPIAMRFYVSRFISVVFVEARTELLLFFWLNLANRVLCTCQFLQQVSISRAGTENNTSYEVVL